MPQQLQMNCHVKPWKCVFEKMKWHQAVKCVKNAGMKKANMAERAGREYIDRLQRIYEDSGRTDSK